MTAAQVTQLAIALGVCFAAYKFISNPIAKAAAIGVGAVIVGRQLPFVGPALSA